MTRKRRFVIAVALLGTSLLAATLGKPQRGAAPFAAEPAEANGGHDASSYDIFLSIPDDAVDREGGVTQLKRAISLHADGRYTAAIAAYDKAAERLPQLADWITVFAASSAARLGDTAQVRRRLGSVDDALANEWGWRTRVLGYERAGAPERAIDAAIAATSTGTPSKRAAAWYRVAGLQRDAGRRSEQKDALLEALSLAAESEAGADAARELVAMDDLTAPQRLAAARALMRNGEVARGARQVQQVLESGSLAEPELSQTRYDLGRVLFSVGRYDDAAEQLKLVKSGSERAADARFLLGRSYARRGDDEASHRTLNNLIADYPTSPAATRSLFLLADFAQDEGNFDDAAALFSRTVSAPAKADETAQAMMRMGGMAFARGDYSDAGRTFDGYRSRFPDGEYHDQATYWAALSRIRNGSPTSGRAMLRELRDASPLSYYGMRAAAMLGEPALTANIKAGPTTTEAALKRVQRGLDRWELLNDVDWNEAAAFELGRLKKHFSGNTAALYAVAEQLQKRGSPHLAIAIGRDLLESGASWDQRLLRIMYPMPYKSLIRQNASAHGLDPYFVAAVIRQESRFNRKAVSGAGAVGLMQVMPATGKQLRKHAKAGRITVAKLTQPDINLRLGTKFLADLMDMYDSRMDAALIAYNAGPTRAYRWRNFPEFATEDLFVERIPFDETREYVKAVKLNLAIYKTLYGVKGSAD